MICKVRLCFTFIFSVFFLLQTFHLVYNGNKIPYDVSVHAHMIKIPLNHLMRDIVVHKSQQREKNVKFFADRIIE